jgi:hypothetical protein
VAHVSQLIDLSSRRPDIHFVWGSLGTIMGSFAQAQGNGEVEIIILDNIFYFFILVAWESAAINATSRAVSLNPWSGDSGVLQALYNYKQNRQK